MKKLWMITGAAGHLGSALCTALRERGEPVRAERAEAYAAELEARLARLEEEVRALRAERAAAMSVTMPVSRFSSVSRRGGRPRASA